VDLGLSDRSAVVCAASRGLGYAIADELSGEGMRVMICARGADDLAAARSRIATRTRGDVHGVVADVATLEGVTRIAAEAKRLLGRVDVLVTNAGGPPAGAFETHTWETWQRAVDLTLRSVVELTRAVLPGMRERRWGRIINVTSIAAKQPVDGLMLSNSVRAAVTGFARSLANEVARDGITVNNVLPGYTRTERVESLASTTAQREGIDPADVIARFESEIPMRRLGDPKELAALTAFLASDRAAYITGQSIAVDGGWIRSLL
jgi:3-oxoacyl-[acyl-carrier protein] reductase